MLVAKDITYSYWGQAQPAVHKARVQVAPGSIVALVGPNGAGKTTLIHCLRACLSRKRAASAGQASISMTICAGIGRGPGSFRSIMGCIPD